MKAKILLISALLISGIAHSQTNSFPAPTGSPVIKLYHPADGISASGYLEFNDVNSRMGYIGFGSAGNNTFHFHNEAGGNFHFLGGNVGIGIGNPGFYKLAIHGTSNSYSNIKLTNDGNLTQGIQFGNINFNSNDGEVWNFENGYFRIGTNNSERLRISANGNVGVGTSSPSQQLQLTSNKPVIRLQHTSDGTTAHAWLEFFDSNSRMGYVGFGSSGNNNFHFNNEAGGDFHFENGSIGVGTATTGTHKLAVEGTIGAREIKVESGAWSDFVFETDYELKPLKEVETFIAENKHLPEIPSEAEVLENGINLGEMDAKLLQKIEELTLYLIEQNKKLESATEKIEVLQKEMVALKGR